MRNKIFMLSFITGILLAGSGCINWIKIVDVKTLDITNVLSGEYREAIIVVNNKSQCFYTLQRVGNAFKLRTRNYNGKELEQKNLPLFTNGYWGGCDITISPDGQKLVYFSESSRSINICDISFNNNITLISNAASSSVCIEMIRFISESEIIIALNKNEDIGRTECQIIKVNLLSKKLSVMCNPYTMVPFHKALSSDNKYLAYVDEDEMMKDKIVILNLSTAEKTVLVKSDKRDSVINNVCWSPDGQKLGYTQGDEIKIIDVFGKKNTTVKSFADNLLCYELKFTDNEHLVYHLGSCVSSPIYEPLRILEIATGKDVKVIKNLEINGRLYVVDDGKKIIVEVGY